MSKRTEDLGNLALQIWHESMHLFDILSRVESDIGDEPTAGLIFELERLEKLTDEAIEMLDSVIEFPALTLLLAGVWNHSHCTRQRDLRTNPPAELSKPWREWITNLSLHRVLAELRDATDDNREAIPSEETKATNRAAIRGRERKTVDDWVVEAISEDPMRFFMSRPEWCDFIAAKGVRRPNETSITKCKTLLALKEQQAKDPNGFERDARDRTGIFAPRNRG